MAERSVRLLEVDPDLGEDLPEAAVAQARERVLAEVVTMPAGPWAFPHRSDVFGGLILSGVVARSAQMGGRVALQLMTAGDVVPVSLCTPGGVAECRVVVELRLALLDDRVMARSPRWLAARLTQRAARWADRALTAQAIAQIPWVGARIVAALWQLAEGCGRARGDGVLVPLDLTHSSLGELVGAQRPTVSLALRDLAERGAVRSTREGWLLSYESRELIGGDGTLPVGHVPGRGVEAITTFAPPRPPTVAPTLNASRAAREGLEAGLSEMRAAREELQQSMVRLREGFARTQELRAARRSS